MPDHYDSDPEDEDFPRPRILSRPNRALCRRLGTTISRDTAADYFHCSPRTIRTCLLNDYHPKDDLSKDPLVLPANWEKTRDELIAKDQIARRKHEMKNKKAELPKKSRTDTKPTEGPGPFSLNFAASSSSSESDSDSDSDADSDALSRFIKDIPLPYAWQTKLRRAGYTADKLQRMAVVSEAALGGFVARSEVFRELSELDKFLVVQAILRVAK
ncbi:hypothetical protein FB45DRAFT_244537 [Roridomyces roridus]|uniref:Uncharacterized protein n=1 Tax=Roridomyces roridus TaxID=1738132 RepID=A0AAD7BB76_9AGAR|nr:hypothetical protein FB45DRAFT_244537 [Roridomyces roridus]